MGHLSLVGRADLLDLIAAAEPEERIVLAELTGYQPLPRPQARPPTRTFGLADLPEQPFSPPPVEPEEAPSPEPSPARAAQQVRFWQCIERRPVEVDDANRVGPEWWTRARLITDRPSEDLATRPAPSEVFLLQWPRMLGFLRHHCTRWQRTAQLDEPRLVRELVRGRPPARLPWRHERRWPSALVLLQDRHLDLYPLRRDYDRLRARLAALLGARLLVVGCDEATDSNRPLADLLAAADITPEAAADARWLILSDLGALSGGGRRARLWQRLVHELAHLDLATRPLVFLPHGTAQPTADESEIVEVSDLTLVPWDLTRPLRPAAIGTRPAAPPAVDQLLVLLSMAVQAHPRLLRKLRLALDAAGIGGGIAWELTAWNHPDVLRLLPECYIHPERRAALQEGFANELPTALQSETLKLIREDNSRTPAYVRDMERLWAAGLEQEGHEANDYLADAIFSLRHMAAQDRDLLLRWAHVSLRGTRPTLAAQNQKLGALQTILAREGKQTAPTAQPEQVDQYAFLFTDEPARDYAIVQYGPALQLVPPSDVQQRPPAHRLTVLRSRSSLIEVSEAADAHEAFWDGGRVPPWALDWGVDEYGSWVDFEALGVKQRLRWIPPGQFMMGSADDEADRDDDEGPRHKVTFSEGFWLGDTACTQAAWQTVMGNNPSHFQGEGYPEHLEHPVEQVSWDDVLGFFNRLNERVAGLDARLPNEAEWEYACRAGTETRYAFGNQITEEQACFDASSTVSVRRYAPNAWGLYQMHGNVYEWCEDCWHENYQGAPGDGAPWLEANSGDCRQRVVRGGSWFNSAWLLRSAYRFPWPRVDRPHFQGFRLSRGPEHRPSQATRALGLAAPARAAEPRAGRQAQSGRRQASSLLSLHAPGEPPGDSANANRLPEAPQLLLRSDQEVLRLQSVTRPQWASVMGRDRYGLFVDFKIKDVGQRLRWIEPGEFMMGAPEDEAERTEYEGPLHSVVFQTGFWLADTACTQALWQAVMGENPSRFKGEDYPDHLQHPVEQVSWDEVQEFIAQLNASVSGLNAWLPSEAQWEYACRAGTETRYSFGDEIGTGQAHLGQDLEKGSTVPGKRFPPNAWGLYQMHGNVWEWCEDCWHENYRGAPGDGAPWLEAESGDCVYRVVRGGSWNYPARNLRSAFRYHWLRDVRNHDQGFRLSRGPELEPGPAGPGGMGVEPARAAPGGAGAAKDGEGIFKRLFKRFRRPGDGK